MTRRSAARTTPAATTAAALALAVSTALTAAAPAPVHAATDSAATECAAGSGVTSIHVDCSKSAASSLANTVDEALKAFGAGGRSSLAKLSGARTVALDEEFQGTAAVVGRGFTLAVGASAEAVATAQNPVSAAVSIASAGSTSVAKADTFGAALAAAVGYEYESGTRTSAHALPFGVAVAAATSSHPSHPASASAAGGWATGVSDPRSASNGASCVALYSTASGGGSSCMSVLFLLTKRTSTAKGAPTIWAVRDLFSLTRLPVLDERAAGEIDTLGERSGLPESVSGRLRTTLAPVFTRDFLRVEQYRNGTYLVRSDMPGLKPFFEWVNPTPWTPSTWAGAIGLSGPPAPVAPTAATVRSTRSVRSLAEIPDEEEPPATPAALIGSAAEDRSSIDAAPKAEQHDPVPAADTTVDTTGKAGGETTEQGAVAAATA